MTEMNLRERLLNTLLTTPHRDLSALLPIHRTLIHQDPRFYAHLAAWYADQGYVRDHKEMFVAMLCTSSEQEHREVGLALLRRLPPYELARVVQFVKGRVARRARPQAARLPGQACANLLPAGEVDRVRGARRAFGSALGRRIRTSWLSNQPNRITQQPHGTLVERIGLGLNVPRSMRGEIERYLHAREADGEAFDRAALTARKALKGLYAGLHIRPSRRAQAVLFDDDPPQDSPAFAVKQIARATCPADQARAIVKHRIPYRIAASIIKATSPAILEALIEVMTPQEVINNIKSLKRRGACDQPNLRHKIDAKLEAAQCDTRVSAYKAKVASAAAAATGKLATTLEAITAAQVKAAGRITRSTALLIDKSGSMQMALGVGKQLGAMISSICDGTLFTYAFDTIAYPIEPVGPHLFQWERAMADLNAAGSTSCGVAVDFMRRIGQRVEQFVFVTDECENAAPWFWDAYEAYAAEFGIKPAITIIKLGKASDLLERNCHGLGIAPSVFWFRGDYYALANVIPFLAQPSLPEMVMTIMSYPLPRRDELQLERFSDAMHETRQIASLQT